MLMEVEEKTYQKIFFSLDILALSRSSYSLHVKFGFNAQAECKIKQGKC